MIVVFLHFVQGVTDCINCVVPLRSARENTPNCTWTGGYLFTFLVTNKKI